MFALRLADVDGDRSDDLILHLDPFLVMSLPSNRFRGRVWTFGLKRKPKRFPLLSLTNRTGAIIDYYASKFPATGR